MRKSRLVLLFSFALSAALAWPPQAPAWSQGRSSARTPAPRGCWYYRDSGFRGASAEIVDGQALPSLGEEWNDQISSITCHPTCTLTVYEHADYGGSPRRINGDVPNVGDAWNDKISAMKMTCRRRVRGIG